MHGCGKNRFSEDPKWYLNGNIIENVDQLEILGVTFGSDCSFSSHVENRVNKAKRSMFSLSSVGMSYPGLNTDSKVNLYNTVISPTLMYGLECINLKSKDTARVQSTQGTIMKYVCGIGKRSHHTVLLQALGISNAENVIADRSKSLFSRICKNDSPTRDLCLYFTKLYIRDNVTIPGTLVSRLIANGVSPTSILCGTGGVRACEPPADGVVDSLSSILFHENYIKPWSNEYLLAKLLTRSF